MHLISDTGILLDLRPHGENHAVAQIFTQSHGRIVGLVHGGQGRRQQPNVQIANIVQCEWRGRTHDQLGTLSLELLHNPSAAVLHDGARLAALQFLSLLLSRILPEHHAYGALHGAYEKFLRVLSAPDWLTQYIHLECFVLSELGYGLDLSRCAMTDEKNSDALAYISPKTGRAATAAAACGYEAQLFPLPRFFLVDVSATPACLAAGLRITGHFLHAAFADNVPNRLWNMHQAIVPKTNRSAKVAA